MAAVNWNNSTGGAWETAANWTGTGLAPTASDDATISLAGTYTVTLGTTGTGTVGVADSANSLTLNDAGATLAIQSSAAGHNSLTIGTLDNIAGKITIATKSVLTITGTETTAELGTITSAGTGVLQLDGDLNNTGATFKIGGTGGLLLTQLEGTITGGTIVDSSTKGAMSFPAATNLA